MTSLIFKVVRHVESTLNNSKLFALICCAMSIGTNLIYSCVGSGASRSSLAVNLGLSSFSNSMNRKFGPKHGFVRSTYGTMFFTCVACGTLFPYSSWILLLSSLFLGFIFSQLLHREVPRNISSGDLEDSRAKFSSICKLFQGFIIMTVTYSFMFFFVTFQ